MKITSNFLLRKALFLSAIFFLTMLFSCKKDGKLSPDFDNDNVAIRFTDTFSITSKVIQEDSLRTDLSTTNLLGLYNDSIFGPMSSSIYTQLLLTGVNVDFNNSISNPTILDSITLTLDYQGIYGDVAAPMTVEVYKLSSPLDANTDYYSNSSVPHETSPIASVTFIPNINNVLRIKLNDSFGDSLIFHSPYVDNTVFTSFFNGLYITVKDSVTGTTIPKASGSIGYFDLNSSSSVVSLYYHNNDVLKNSTKYDFLINSDGIKFSHFEHNYTGTDIAAHLNNSPTKDTTVTYVSSMAGVKTKIEIPNIKDLTNDGPVAINKAEIIFTVEDDTDETFAFAPSSLSLVGVDAAGDAVFLPDFFEGQDHYGGILTDNGTKKTYTFNITRHIHQLIYFTATDYGMYLIANGSTTTANRAVISSENSSGFNIKLEITYSKI